MILVRKIAQLPLTPQKIKWSGTDSMQKITTQSRVLRLCN